MNDIKAILAFKVREIWQIDKEIRAQLYSLVSVRLAVVDSAMRRFSEEVASRYLSDSKSAAVANSSESKHITCLLQCVPRPMCVRIQRKLKYVDRMC